MKNIVTVKAGVPTLEVHDPFDLAGYTLVDVRGADEFDGELGHIEGAKLVTLGEELEDYLRSEDKNKKILFICRSGGRSGVATKMAAANGFKDVFNMAGGMLYWNQKKFAKC